MADFESEASDYFDLSELATSRIRFTPPTRLTCGSENRRQQALRLVNRIFHRQCDVIRNAHGIVIDCSGLPEATIKKLCSKATEKLTALENASVSSKMAEEALAITSAERRLWTKDGRLPPSGNAAFSSGRKTVRLFTYAPQTILDLVARPDRIADWRKRDQKTEN